MSNEREKFHSKSKQVCRNSFRALKYLKPCCYLESVVLFRTNFDSVCSTGVFLLLL